MHATLVARQATFCLLWWRGGLWQRKHGLMAYLLFEMSLLSCDHRRHNTTTTTITTMDDVYEQFRNYDFEKSPSYKNTLDQVYNQYLIVMSDKDLEVKQDLSNGVFNPDRIPAADREQLQLQTKIFVFCSETENIMELQDYQFWLGNKEREEAAAQATSTIEDVNRNIDTNHIQGGDSIVVDSAPEEEYTSNYQEIVDMIVNNKPIPGIKEIPKTILDPEDASQSILKQRKKPWETDTEEKQEAKSESAAVSNDGVENTVGEATL